MGRIKLRRENSPLTLEKIVNLMLMSLKPAERFALRKRFGLWDGKKQTFDVIGKSLDVTRQRALQIVEEAGKKLRDRCDEGETLAWFLKAKENRLPSLLASCEGVATKEELVETVLSLGGRGRPKLALAFLGDLFKVDASALFRDWIIDRAGIYFFDSATQKKFNASEASLYGILSEREAPIPLSLAVRLVSKHLGSRVTRKWLRRCATVSKDIGLDKFGSVCLRQWSYFDPKTNAEMARRALIEIGRPARAGEIIAAMTSLFPKEAPFSMGSIINALTSEACFVPVRHGVYGLTDWKIERVPTIRQFLVSQIKQNGGSAHVDDLIASAAAKWGVRSTSVRKYLRDTSVFMQISSDGNFRLTPSR